MARKDKPGHGHGEGEDRPPSQPPVPDVAERLGAGNYSDLMAGPSTQSQYDTLSALGAGCCRINMTPAGYLVQNDWSHPKPESLDALARGAYLRGLWPIFLFEWYQSTNASIGIGDYSQWHNIGRQFTARFRPGGTWAQANGAGEWGIDTYALINEPERTWGVSAADRRPVSEYYDAVKGLADGIHSIDPALNVIPGGFYSPNAFNDWTLRGLGPLLAPLWNDGTLDGIDLHTYYDVQYAPMEGNRWSSSHYDFSRFKRDSGVTADIGFYSTEFNYKLRNCTEEQAARGLLTGIWDNLGVVGNDRMSSATRMAMPWNLFTPEAKDPLYGMCSASSPWTPNLRGQVFRLVMDLIQGLQFVFLDPFVTGEFRLQGPGKVLWAWQNRSGWTNHPGTTYTVTSIPLGYFHLEVWGWDGLRETISIGGHSSVTVTGLDTEQTYMFLGR